MTDSFKIELTGVTELQESLQRVSSMLDTYMQAAGAEAVKNEILTTVGLQIYPPETAANLPPVPYYIRGTGMQTSASYNTGKSQHLGEKWVTTGIPYGIKLSNSVSYSGFVHGKDTQAAAMGAIGWRKLWDVAEEKRAAITNVFQRWFDKLLHDAGLK